MWVPILPSRHMRTDFKCITFRLHQHLPMKKCPFTPAWWDYISSSYRTHSHSEQGRGRNCHIFKIYHFAFFVLYLNLILYKFKFLLLSFSLAYLLVYLPLTHFTEEPKKFNPSMEKSSLMMMTVITVWGKIWGCMIDRNIRQLWTITCAPFIIIMQVNHQE